MNFLICTREEDLMGINGKTGHGRGNNRRRHFKRRENGGEEWQKGNSPGSDPNRPIGGRRSEAASEHGQTPGRTPENHHTRHTSHKRGADRQERQPYIERPKWVPPKFNTEPLPVSDCPWCGKPIRDISSAISDKESGSPVHFDCVLSRISFGEKLEKGETITYIGGGRFGIVSFDNSAQNNKDSQEKAPGNSQHSRRQAEERKSSNPSAQSNTFTIKKIIEWEDKDKRAEWRSVICDHYSVT